MATVRPVWSETLRRFYGICAHPNFRDSTYAVPKHWTHRVWHHHATLFRGMYAHNQTATIAQVIAWARQYDLSWVATVYPAGFDMTLAELDARLEHLAANAADRVVAIEGVNEPNGTGAPSDWPERAAQIQARIAAKARTDPRLSHVVVLSPALRQNSPTITQDYARLAATGIAADFDAVSVHSYPGGFPPGNNLDRDVNRAVDAYGDMPVWVTETGYQTALGLPASSGPNPVSPAAAGSYATRNVLTCWAHPNVDRMLRYEELDEPNPANDDAEDAFGIVECPARDDTTWTAKPEYTNLRAFLATLSDEVAFHRPGVFDITVNSSAPVEWVATGRSDGLLVVWLWRDVSVWDVDGRRNIPVAPVPVTVSVAGRRTVTCQVGGAAVGCVSPVGG